MVAVTLSETPKTDVKFKYGLEVKNVTFPEPEENQSLIKVQAAALNHR
jgi:NADPH:quinone reductase-like Zn-dependent oxidoreductase